MVYEYLKNLLGTFTAKGWPRSAYGTSKLGINMYARVLSRYQQVVDKNIQVYVCHPGYVNVNNSWQQIRPIWQAEKVLSQLNKDVSLQYIWLNYLTSLIKTIKDNFSIKSKSVLSDLVIE